jgi:hypothetical protein
MRRFMVIAAALFICLFTVPAGAAYYGDINGDDTSDVNDAIIALQVVANVPNAFDGFDISTSPHMDVNGDGKVGLEESAYALQRSVGAREEKTFSGASVFFGSGLAGLLWLRRKFRQRQNRA